MEKSILYMQTQFNVFAKVFFTSSATLSHHLLVLVACKLESFLYELHIKSTPLVMHEELLKEPDTALNVFPVLWTGPKGCLLFGAAPCVMPDPAGTHRYSMTHSWQGTQLANYACSLPTDWL